RIAFTFIVVSALVVAAAITRWIETNRARRRSPQSLETSGLTPPFATTLPQIEEDPESAARYFEQFNPKRPMNDLTVSEWMALGALYSTHIQRGSDGGKEWERRY